MLYVCLDCVGGTLGTLTLQDGWTALISAAYKGHADCLRLLLDAGADMNAKNRVRAVGPALSAVGRMPWNSVDESLVLTETAHV